MFVDVIYRMRNNIKNLRKNLGLSQAEFAEAIGISDKMVSAWERNERRLNDQWIATIAKRFKVPVSYIIGDDGGDEWFLRAYHAASPEIKIGIDALLRAVDIQDDLGKHGKTK